MPSEIHELLVEVFRSRPEVVVTLARTLSLVPLSGHERARAAGEGVSGSVTDYRPDCVVELRDEAGRLVRTVVVEVQLRRDAHKRFALPVYQALLRARHRCPCDVMVVTPVAHVADAMRAPIPLGERSSFGALVVGPAELARLGRGVDDPPELWFLRAVATVERDPRVLLEAPAVLERLAEPTAALYLDHLLSKVPGAVRAALGVELERAMLNFDTYEFKSDFFRERIARWKAEAEAAGREEGLVAGREEGLVAGREEGREEGREAGREEGRVEGEAHGLKRAILSVLEARGIAVAPEERSVLEASGDLAQLATWLRRAAVASSAAEVLAAGGAG